MGYRRQSTVIVMEWPEEHELHGLQVRCRSASIGTIRRMLDLAKQADSKDIGAADLGAIDELFTGFVKRVVGWNLEHETADGEWVQTPATVEGLDFHDADFVMEMIMAWLTAAMGSPEGNGDLPKDSPAGKQSVEQSLTMEPL